jgi:hypothetical protein
MRPEFDECSRQHVGDSDIKGCNPVVIAKVQALKRHVYRQREREREGGRRRDTRCRQSYKRMGTRVTETKRCNKL